MLFRIYDSSLKNKDFLSKLECAVSCSQLLKCRSGWYRLAPVPHPTICHQQTVVKWLRPKIGTAWVLLSNPPTFTVQLGAVSWSCAAQLGTDWDPFSTQPSALRKYAETVVKFLEPGILAAQVQCSAVAVVLHQQSLVLGHFKIKLIFKHAGIPFLYKGHKVQMHNEGKEEAGKKQAAQNDTKPKALGFSTIGSVSDVNNKPSKVTANNHAPYLMIWSQKTILSHQKCKGKCLCCQKCFFLQYFPQLV